MTKNKGNIVIGGAPVFSDSENLNIGDGKAMILDIELSPEFERMLSEKSVEELKDLGVVVNGDIKVQEQGETLDYSNKQSEQEKYGPTKYSDKYKDVGIER